MKLTILIFVFAMLLTGCSDDMHTNIPSNFSKSSYSSAGERLYFTGQSESGEAINSTGGSHHMQMHSGSCVTCHGVNKEGGARMWPWFWVTAPPLTRSALLGDHKDEGHSHTIYDANSLKKAIVEGINPSGEELDDLMPRWQMSEQELNHLVDFLLQDKTKDNHSG